MLALVVVAAVAWAIVATTSPDSRERGDAPARLLNPSKVRVVSIDIVDATTGRRVALAGAPLDSLAAELRPLLAIRVLPTVRAEYGLDAPVARIEAWTELGPLPAILVGATNFDSTGYYVRIEGRPGAALVLKRIGDTAKAALSS